MLFPLEKTRKEGENKERKEDTVMSPVASRVSWEGAGKSRKWEMGLRGAGLTGVRSFP